MKKSVNFYFLSCYLDIIITAEQQKSIERIMINLQLGKVPFVRFYYPGDQCTYLQVEVVIQSLGLQGCVPVEMTSFGDQDPCAEKGEILNLLREEPDTTLHSLMERYRSLRRVRRDVRCAVGALAIDLCSKDEHETVNVFVAADPLKLAAILPASSALSVPCPHDVWRIQVDVQDGKMHFEIPVRITK